MGRSIIYSLHDVNISMCCGLVFLLSFFQFLFSFFLIRGIRFKYIMYTNTVRIGFCPESLWAILNDYLKIFSGPATSSSSTIPTASRARKYLPTYDSEIIHRSEHDLLYYIFPRKYFIITSFPAKCLFFFLQAL